MLAVQSAVAWLAAAVGTGVALRGRQLVDAETESLPEMLVRLPGPDGDTGFYSLLIASVVLLVGLAAVLLTIATYLSTSSNRVDLRLVRATLAGEIALGTGRGLGVRLRPQLGLACPSARRERGGQLHRAGGAVASISW